MFTLEESFVDIYKANNDPKIEAIILMINSIFQAERKFREDKLNAEQIYQARHEESYMDLLNRYFDHLDGLHYSPTSVTGKAVAYSTRNKKELMSYLDDGNIPIDNNIAERGIKPFVINRKTFLFSNTEK